tara:strand:- start:5787 stop:6815 length:1029 start_codon:yes stop_codon:yes gene_type:complete
MSLNLEETIFIFVLFCLLSWLLNHLILLNRKNISSKLNLIDYPDNKRKIHKFNTPLIASIPSLIIFNFICAMYFLYGDTQVLTLVLLCNFTYIVGFFDDTKNLSHTTKLLIISIVLLFTLSLTNFLLIDKLYTETHQLFLILNNFESLILTTLCILLLINAVNLADGINSLVVLIILIWSVYMLCFFEGRYNYILLGLIPIFIINIYFIFKNKYFLGDSGSLFLGMLIALITIDNYNESIINNDYISVENLFLLFMIPGIDMLRLFIQRLLNKRNPFSGDTEHLHHYLIKKYTLINSLFIYGTMIFIPLLAGTFFKINIYFILFFIFLYFVIFFFLKKAKID